MGGIKSKLQVKDFNEKDLQMVNVKTPMNPEDVEKSLLYLEKMQNVGKEQEQQKSLEKQEGPLKITFFGDDDVEEMLDLTTLYKYINSNVVLVCFLTVCWYSGPENLKKSRQKNL